ncbi:DUF3726 domain-containing protein [uncultured Roseobacter sp.]|uniref:DUF3726 domain-containing protein n=1 Tax=uncultured Roseobacter sp. TaxID=114847 RepID=UPI00263881EF|nr:DUF3726 domain-containing protein [uncultured Roseobacter sp.]
MSWSASEIAALATKAARGAGAPAGQAARFGEAAAFCLMTGGAPAALEAALAAVPAGGPVLDLPAALDGIIARQGGELRSDAPAILIRAYVAVLPFAADATETGHGRWKIMVDLTRPSPRPTPRRISGCDGLIACMSELAARTFVPESEASRAAGAGAGLNDND